MAEQIADRYKPSQQLTVNADGSINTNVYAEGLIVSSANPLPVTANITVSDIQIGAVEIKNSSDDTRAIVTVSNALKVDGSAVTQPISATSLPLPTGASLEVTQSDIKSLIETLQELISRLSVLAAVKGVNESLRVTPISSVSTAVTGPITSAQHLANELTKRIAIENTTAILSNINNVVIS